MATANAIEAPPKDAGSTQGSDTDTAHQPGAKDAVRHSVGRSYVPDQWTLVFWIACALLILGMNVYDLVMGVLGW